MSKIVIHVECGGKYVGKGDKIRWDSKDGKVSALTFKEEVTYMMLVEKICKKIRKDESKVKMKLSYIPLVLKPLKVVEILDDDDVEGYLCTMDKKQCRSLLHVELIHCKENENLLEREVQSLVILNDGEMDSNGKHQENRLLHLEERLMKKRKISKRCNSRISLAEWIRFPRQD